MAKANRNEQTEGNTTPTEIRGFSLDALSEASQGQTEKRKPDPSQIQRMILDVLLAFKEAHAQNPDRFASGSWVLKNTIVRLLDGRETVDGEGNRVKVDEPRIAAGLASLASGKVSTTVQVCQKKDAGKGKAPLFYNADLTAEMVHGLMIPRQ